MSNLPRPDYFRTEIPRSGPPRPVYPHQIARVLYGTAFDAITRDEVEQSMLEFRRLNQKDQLFILGHLLYLNLQAEAGTQRALAGVREVLHDIADASYAILEEVNRPRLEAEYEASMGADAMARAQAAGFEEAARMAQAAEFEDAARMAQSAEFERAAQMAREETFAADPYRTWMEAGPRVPRTDYAPGLEGVPRMTRTAEFEKAGRMARAAEFEESARMARAREFPEAGRTVRATEFEGRARMTRMAGFKDAAQMARAAELDESARMARAREFPEAGRMARAAELDAEALAASHPGAWMDPGPGMVRQGDFPPRPRPSVGTLEAAFNAAPQSARIGARRQAPASPLATVMRSSPGEGLAEEDDGPRYPSPALVPSNHLAHGLVPNGPEAGGEGDADCDVDGALDSGTYEGEEDHNGEGGGDAEQ